MRKKRGQALVDDGGVGRVVGSEAHPDGGETRHCLQKQLKIVVRSFSLPTPCQALAGKQKGRHVLGQVGQRRQLLRQRNQQLADVIACCYTMLVEHGVDDLARSEHVRRKVWEGGAEGVLICLADACQQSGGKGAAGETVVIVLGYGHAVDINDSRRGIVGVSLGHVEGWAIAINRSLAGGHIDGVGKVYRHSLPFGVWHHEGEGTRDVMHGAHASGVGFDVFGPFL